MEAFSWQGKFIRLRAASLEDSHFLHYFENDDLPKSKEEIQSQQGDDRILMIEDISKKAVGWIRTYDSDRKNGVFSYFIFIDPAQRRRGYAKESITMVLSFFFQELRYQKVNAPVSAFNKISATLHEKMGFEMEGRLRKMLYTHGQYFDLFFYGMTAEEFDQIVTRAYPMSYHEKTVT